MSDFFDSEIVKTTMNELAWMQQELIKQVMHIPYMDVEEKKEHLQLMKDFLEKQKLLFFRMTLSDDPEAQETKNQILESAKMFGLMEDQGMDEFFKMLQKTIDSLEKTLGL